MISASDVAIARRVLLRRARLLLDQHGVPDLMLSGGVDSATILFALLDLAETNLAALGPAAPSQLRAIAQIRTRYGLE